MSNIMYATTVLLLLAVVTKLDKPTDLLEAWKRGADSIETYDLYISAHLETFVDPANDWRKRGTPDVQDYSSHQTFKRGRRRIEPLVKLPTDQRNIIIVWDGALAKAFNSTSKELVLEPELTFTTPEGISQIDYETAYRTFTGNLVIPKIIRERSDLRIDGWEGSSIKLYAPPTSEKVELSPFGFRVWLDTDKNFMPVRIQHLLRGDDGDYVYGEWNNVVEEVATGVWAPVKCVVIGWPPPGAAKHTEKASEATIRVNMTASIFNREVDDSVFSLSVPTGTQVHDRITGARYAFGNAEDAAAHLSELVLSGQAGTEQLERFTHERQIPPGVLRKRSYSLWLLWIAGAVVVASLLYVMSRRSRSSPNSQ